MQIRKLQIVFFCFLLLGISKSAMAQDPIELFQQSFDNKKYSAAEHYFEQAWELDSINTKPFLIKYLTLFAIRGEYEKAYTILQPYIIADNLPSYLKEKANALYTICSFAKRNKQQAEIVITNMGDSINTPAAEYFPTIDFQDSLFIFMRRADWKREDFYTSSLGPNGFTKAALMLDSLNKPDKKGSASLSKDMQTLYFAADYPEQGFGRYDIYSVHKTNAGWSVPKNLGRNINTDFWDSAPSIAPDGKALYFCSNRPGGYGGIDIYVSYKNERGGWQEAENMGPQINTAGDEQTPFMHADNKSLYFSSTGWPGFGGADLFVSRRLSDENWSTPLNLGFPINTYDNEGSISVAHNGMDAYMASDRADSRGGLDIYKVELAVNTRANQKDTSAIVPNKVQVFKQVLFIVNTATFIDAAIPELIALVQYLNENNKANITIEGHTDNSGIAAQNIMLSQARADAIQKYLINNGIAAKRITAIGYGSSIPITSNENAEGRAANRRTSFKISF
jgi:outer membrane protein OmpA-like peptidoglycan-associated protein